MPDQNFAAVSVALEQRFRRELHKQPNRSAVTLNLLRKRAGKGKNAAWTVQVGTAVGVYYDDGEDVGAYQTDTKLPATLNWAEFGDSFAITGRAEDAVAGADQEMSQLFMHDLRDASDRAAAKGNIEIWSGLGTAAPQKILGLATAAGPLDASGTYAGVDRATYPQWAASKYTNSGVVRAFNWGLVDVAYKDAYIAAGRGPKAMVTTPAIWTRGAEALEPSRRYLQEVYIRGQKVILDAGWQALNWNGIPVFMDKDAPSGHFAGLDLDAIDVEFLPVAPARTERGEVLAFVPIAGTPEEQGEKPPAQALMAALYKLARTGNKAKFQLLCTAQLTATRCNSSFLITDLGA